MYMNIYIYIGIYSTGWYAYTCIYMCADHLQPHSWSRESDPGRGHLPLRIPGWTCSLWLLGRSAPWYHPSSHTSGERRIRRVTFLHVPCVLPFFFGSFHRSLFSRWFILFFLDFLDRFLAWLLLDPLQKEPAH